MIKINYVLSVLLHFLVMFFLLIFFELNKSKNTYHKSININIKTLPLLKKNEQSHSENNSLTTKREEKEIEINTKKNTESNIKSILSEIKTDKTEEKKQIIKKHKNIQKDDKEIKAQAEKKNNPKPENNLNNFKVKENKKSENILKPTFSDNDNEIFNNYNDELKALIQKKAAQNYPRASLRRNEEGAVDLIFSIDMRGNIFNIKIGKKTNASERLINSAIETLNLISPYKRNNILKKKNTFSIIIVYKLE